MTNLSWKIVELDEAVRTTGRVRKHGMDIVFTNGCFDLFHIGHLHCLSEITDRDRYLVVGLNDDDSVRRLKGEGHPIMPFQDRAEILAALHIVNLVVPLQEDTPWEMIRALKPDILVKGEEYEREGCVGSDLLNDWDGVAYYVRHTHDISSTRLIERIRAL